MKTLKFKIIQNIYKNNQIVVKINNKLRKMKNYKI